MTVSSFYVTCSIIWIIEIFLWIKAFKINTNITYFAVFILTMIFSAIMHYLGIETTHAQYSEIRAEHLISIGVPGFDAIQIVIVLIAHIFVRRKIHKA